MYTLGPYGFVCEQCKKFYTNESAWDPLGYIWGQLPWVGEGGNRLVCELVLVKKASRKLHTKTKRKKRRIYEKHTNWVGSFGIRWVCFSGSGGQPSSFWGPCQVHAYWLNDTKCKEKKKSVCLIILILKLDRRNQETRRALPDILTVKVVSIVLVNFP